MHKILLMLTLLVFVPNVNAGFSDGREATNFILQANPGNGVVAPTVVVVHPVPWTFDSPAGADCSVTPSINCYGTAFYEISATYTSREPAVGAAITTFQFYLNGVAVAGCTWQIIRDEIEFVPGVTVGHNPDDSALILSHHYFLRCPTSAFTGGFTATYEIRVTGTNAVTNSRIDIVLRRFLHVTDTSHDSLATFSQVQARTTQTNTYINQTRQQVSLSETNITALIQNLTDNIDCSDMNCTILLNNTEVIERLMLMDTEVGQSIESFLWLLIVILTCIWALWQKHKPLYFVAVAACVLTVFWLPTGLVGLRAIVVFAIFILLYDLNEQRRIQME